MKLKKLFILCVLPVFILSSCTKDVKLEFENNQLERTDAAHIKVLYPRAKGTDAISKKLNTDIEQFVANELNLTDEQTKMSTIPDAMTHFDTEYKNFKAEYKDSSQLWEATVDGEVAYLSDDILCISMQSYTDTGGAHGNQRVTFLNYNPKTGERLDQKQLITDMEAYKDTAKLYFKKEVKSEAEDGSMTDFFFGQDFQLPETIGFSETGMILLYNNYEIASYAQGVTEFTIPYADTKSFLKF